MSFLLSRLLLFRLALSRRGAAGLFTALCILAVTAGSASAERAEPFQNAQSFSFQNQSAQTQARPSAVVTMGDSYISGEAGRWEGNSFREYGNRRSTDRAAYRTSRFGRWRYSQSRVYGPTGASGCHRSDVAPVLSSAIDVDELINIACSGSTTRNLMRADNGGTGRYGEPSQAEQLVSVADSHNVEMIVVSVGGNDLGFGSIIADCAFAYILSNPFDPKGCRDEQQQAIDAKMSRAMSGVGDALDDIRAVMSDAGYAEGDYRLVLQSYPSPVPSGDEFRYREVGLARAAIGRCPFWNADATWARDSFVPQLSDSLASVAASRNVEFLDLQDALEGREACAKTTAQGDDDDAAWARFFTVGLLQGEAQESLHPNAYGQMANGTCIRLLHSAAPGSYRCNNVPGQGPDVMSLSSL